MLTFENKDPGAPILFDIVASRPRRGRQTSKPATRGEPQDQRTVVDRFTTPPAAAMVARLGRIASVRDGIAYVDFEGNPAGPRPARTTVPLRNLKEPVLLLMPDDEPVIVGQLYAGVPIEPAGCEGADVVVKGRSVRIEAEAELVLTAGGCKIHLDARGKAVTTADQVVSRARSVNKVQGGCVKLN